MQKLFCSSLFNLVCNTWSLYYGKSVSYTHLVIRRSQRRLGVFKQTGSLLFSSPLQSALILFNSKFVALHCIVCYYLNQTFHFIARCSRACRLSQPSHRRFMLFRSPRLFPLSQISSVHNLLGVVSFRLLVGTQFNNVSETNGHQTFVSRDRTVLDGLYLWCPKLFYVQELSLIHILE